MKLNLTKEQYRWLVFMASISDDVLGLLGDYMDSKEAQYELLSKESQDILSYLLSHAEDFDSEDLIAEYKGRRYLNEDAYREVPQTILEDYEDLTMYQDLANKLAWRDFYRDHSKKEIKEMEKKNMGYFGVELHDYERKYWDEFDEHDYNRLEIKK